jgi:hypothetical protein
MQPIAASPFGDVICRKTFAERQRTSSGKEPYRGAAAAEHGGLRRNEEPADLTNPNMVGRVTYRVRSGEIC